MSKSVFKESKEDYIRCDRCENNNLDDPSFWGCPRGSCEAETIGTIYTVIKAVEI